MLSIYTAILSRKKKPLPLLKEVSIENIGAEGKSIARVDNMVVFVKEAVPGDVADLHLFVPHIPGREIEADTLEVYRKVDQYKIEPKEQPEPEPEVQEGECPCGCGGEVKEGNKYATSGCVTRHRLRSE